jgi:hypothetical protein
VFHCFAWTQWNWLNFLSIEKKVLKLKLKKVYTSFDRKSELRPIFCINTSLKHFRQVWTSLDQLCKVGCITARWNPSSIYKWSIGHILEQEFFYFGFLGSSGSKGKKVDLSYSEQLLRVVFVGAKIKFFLNILATALKRYIKWLLYLFFEKVEKS